MKRLFLFIGNLAACIVENVSTLAEEQPLCKPYSRRSELFRTNHFWRFDKVSDEIKPHNKKQEIPQQSLRVLTFFYRKHFLLQFLQSPGTCSIREQFKVILQIWWSRGNLFIILLFWWAVNSQMWTEPWNIKGRFPESWGLRASVSSSPLPLPLPPFFLLLL